ncbi:MAG: helix-turn-helix domain-containing protein [Firmicutes bacterium]|nr:helix-turn-helix domain-containing protein [Bacillota bacterium]
MVTLTKQLRKARLAQKKTLRKLAEETGISYQYISDIELGKKDPSLGKLEILAGALNHKIMLVPSKKK